ncbi:hypothetical protein VTN00DRAFT_9702 [Thermoascus crustaceus]|uniref:uncharacterized protein n=1 Tax=Thermoascus crustaceus TaxID=5088 RepID=UPI003742DE0A
MSRPRLPLTPSMSAELVGNEQPCAEGSECFSLPPAALSPTAVDARRKNSTASCCPTSPTSPDLAAMGGNSRPVRQAAGTKRPLEHFDLPPPPTRTRKIIQMKPKVQSQERPAEAANKAKDSGKAAANGAAPANSKKKQPSATSAAGRKIARKTAHSLIERRRRSKMNEEFATLKNMIPACKGQEMHKLAILQASIDYVNYLEQCIADLKTAGGRNTTLPPMPPAPPSPTSPDVLPGGKESGESAQSSPELLPSNTHDNNVSPSFSPRGRQYPSRLSIEFNTTTLPSPALGPSQSPDVSRREQRFTWTTTTTSASASPAILPQRNSVSSGNAESDIDHEASAALLMLNMDRRGTMDSSKDVPVSTPLPPPSDDGSDNSQDKQRKMGMSVRDLLIS